MPDAVPTDPELDGVPGTCIFDSPHPYRASVHSAGEAGAAEGPNAQRPAPQGQRKRGKQDLIRTAMNHGCAYSLPMYEGTGRKPMPTVWQAFYSASSVGYDIREIRARSHIGIEVRAKSQAGRTGDGTNVRAYAA